MFDRAVNITFYVNLAVMFCAIAQSVSTIVLCKKTAYRIEVGLTSVFIFGFAFIAYIIQLVLYTMGSGYAPYSVYATLALFGCGYLVCALYCFMMATRSNRVLCRTAGVFALVPPVGTVFIIKLSYRLRGDTRAQGLVFNGYTYTIAALRAFALKNKGRYIDADGEPDFENLTPKAARKHVKALKKKAKDGAGLFDYAEALMHYMPDEQKRALKALNKSAKLDYPAALFNLGYMHETGAYLKKDIKKAKEYYRRASGLGDKDAELRLGIVEIGAGNADAGVAVFEGLMKKGDDIAQYNLALCAERGEGMPRDGKRAVELYAGCARRGLFAAQKRLFAVAAESVNTADLDSTLRELAALKFDGEFALVMRGVIAVKEKRASDAAAEFLEAVKLRGRWEGFARLFVGALYIDCGKLERDRINGAAYIRTAVEMTPLAREVYLTVPPKLRKENKTRGAKPSGKPPASKPTQTPKPQPKPAAQAQAQAPAPAPDKSADMAGAENCVGATAANPEENRLNPFADLKN